MLIYGEQLSLRVTFSLEGAKKSRLCPTALDLAARRCLTGSFLSNDVELANHAIIIIIIIIIIRCKDQNGDWL